MPTWTKARKPAAYMASTSGRNRTGSRRWRTNSARTSSGSAGNGAAVVPDQTGTRCGRISAASTPRFMGPRYGREHRRVEAGAEREHLADHALGPELRRELLDRLFRAAHHRLAGRVVVREDEIRPVGERLAHPGRGGADRRERQARHPERVGVEGGEEVVRLVGREHAARDHRRPFPDAVSGDPVGPRRRARAGLRPGSGRRGAHRARAGRRRSPRCTHGPAAAARSARPPRPPGG